MPRPELKEWFEANYLDGDKIQDGQMIASSECFKAIKSALVYYLQSEEAKEMVKTVLWNSVRSGGYFKNIKEDAVAQSILTALAGKDTKEVLQVKLEGR